MNLTFFTSRFALGLTLLAFFCMTSFAQVTARVSGLCLYDSDHLNDDLYLFPPDKRTLNIFEDLLAKSGKSLKVVVKAANVPEVAAAENGNERLLLYNQFVLDRFQKESKKDWALTMVIAHQIGHHASVHSFNLEPKMRLEIELEADRFAGYLMFHLGATIADIQGLTEVFNRSSKDPIFPEPKARLAATI